MKLTYNEIFSRRNAIDALTTNVKTLSAGTRTSLLLISVAMRRKEQEYEEITRDALAEIKKEERFKGFDAMAAEMAKANGVITKKQAHDEWNGEGKQPRRPTDEQIAEAEATLKGLDDYRAMEAEIINEWLPARKKTASLETEIEYTPLTRAELEEIVGYLGTTPDDTRLLTSIALISRSR